VRATSVSGEEKNIRHVCTEIKKSQSSTDTSDPLSLYPRGPSTCGAGSAHQGDRGGEEKGGEEEPAGHTIPMLGGEGVNGRPPPSMRGEQSRKLRGGEPGSVTLESL